MADLYYTGVLYRGRRIYIESLPRNSSAQQSVDKEQALTDFHNWIEPIIPTRTYAPDLLKKFKAGLDSCQFHVEGERWDWGENQQDQAPEPEGPSCSDDKP